MLGALEALGQPQAAPKKAVRTGCVTDRLLRKEGSDKAAHSVMPDGCVVLCH
jgi:hypothetical protein